MEELLPHVKLPSQGGCLERRFGLGGWGAYLNCTPAKAPIVPRQLMGRWNCLSVTNASQSEAKLASI
jgi:hypothetical protein